MKWDKSATGDVNGYYILIRETDQSMWQKKIFTKELKIMIPYSKDNYFLAVQSVSKDGNESLPVVPDLER